MTNEKQIKTIPNFKNRQEMAEWYDTHDIADYQHEFKTVDAVFDLEDTQQDIIAVRVKRNVKDTLTQIAKKKGLSVSTLARMWIMEKLQSGMQV